MVNKVIVYLLLIAILIIFSYYLFATYDLKLLFEKKNIIDDFKAKNYFLFISIFIIFSIIWTIFIGLGTPLTLFSGFFFGNIVGTLITLICFSLGSTIFFFFFKKNSN